MKGLTQPAFFDRLQICPRCGYDLGATDVSLPCPECGQVNGLCVQLAGVPRHLGGAVHRRVLRIVVVIGAVLLAQAVLIVWAFSLRTALLLLVMFVLAVVWLMVSSPRERGGTERFLIVAGALVRLPAKADGGVLTDSLRVEIDAGDTVQLRVIGTQWAGLVIARADSSKKFEAGFACADAEVARVGEMIAAVVGGGVRVVW
ncbi:hypothetical protein LBMAG48_01720 [Phycisphaerae bacterium]|nr:hypothetical protein LBMAG48_01720 [Phycisphaerae bacterium]